TVRGGAYPRAIHALRAEVSVVQQPCQVFVALAEEGWTHADVTVAAASRYLGPLFEGPSAPDTIVLGCTHFPVVAGALWQIICKVVTMVDSADTTAEAVAEALAAHSMANDDRGG